MHIFAEIWHSFIYFAKIKVFNVLTFALSVSRNEFVEEPLGLEIATFKKSELPTTELGDSDDDDEGRMHVCVYSHMWWVG